MEITDKQKSYINFIQEETGIEFKGTTKKEAKDYISENKYKMNANVCENMWSIINGY